MAMRNPLSDRDTDVPNWATARVGENMVSSAAAPAPEVEMRVIPVRGPVAADQALTIPPQAVGAGLMVPVARGMPTARMVPFLLKATASPKPLGVCPAASAVCSVPWT